MVLAMKILNFIKDFFTNKPGICLVLANFLVAIWGLIEKEGNFRHFHFYYEPLSTKILALINTPAIMFAETVDRLFFTYQYHLSAVIISNFEFALIVIFSCVQWLLVGHIINQIYRTNSDKHS